MGANGAIGPQAEPIPQPVWRQKRPPDWGPEPIASLDQWEAMERTYWETYAKVVTETGWQQPEKAGELVESRMEMFKRQSIMTDQRWRRARGL